MRRALSLSILVLLTELALVAPAAAQSPTFEENERCVSAKDVDACTALMRDYPDSIYKDWWIKARSEGYEKKGDHAAAQRDHETYLGTDMAKREAQGYDDDDDDDYYEAPWTPDQSIIQLADQKQKAGDMSGALAALDKAIAETPSSSSPAAYHEAKADIYAAEKWFSEAVDEATKQIAVSSKPYIGLRKRGGFYLQMGKPDQAIEDLSKALELEPEYDNARLDRGLAYEKKGDKARALADLEPLLLKRPKAEEVKDALRRVYRMP